MGKVSDFFNIDFVDYASYATLRAIGGIMDGQKNAGRKILKTVIDKNIKKELKVSQLSSKMAEYTEYLHGDASGSIITMAQDYVGTNNMPLLVSEGNFGTRFKNEASAPRYIYTFMSENMERLFNPDDKQILIKQYFEGDEIEPKFYLPSLPVLLINGSEGVATGFAQKILPRSEKDIEKYLKTRLGGKSAKFNFKPHYNGFNGKIVQGEESNKWEIQGIINRKSASKIEITELPIGYELKKYIQVLDRLEDDGVISGYIDRSDNNIFNFEVQFKIADLKKMSDSKVLEKLKLIKKVSENYTVIDKDNRVKVFNNPSDIFDYYYDIKISNIQLRKDHLIQKITKDIQLDVSKYLFIKMIVDEKLKINKRKKLDIEKDLDKIDKIIKSDSNYDYLLRIQILSLTKERMEKLMNDIKTKKAELDLVKSQTLEMIWLRDLS